jgi:ferrous iron transport protein A
MTQRLQDLSPGTTVRILSFDDTKSGYVRQIARLGLTPGTTFRVVRRAPLGDPIEIKLRGYSLALRPDEADILRVQVIE